MPIVYVHGVATRDNTPGYEESWEAIETLLREYIAPVISDRPDQIAIAIAYWGDQGASLPSGGRARPRGPLLGMGATDAQQPSPVSTAEFASTLAQIGSDPVHVAPSTRLAPAGPVRETELSTLTQLGPDELSNLLVVAMPKDSTADTESPVTDPAASGRGQRAAWWAIAADQVARDPQTTQRLAQCDGLEDEVNQLIAMVEAQYQGTSDRLAGMGAGDWWRSLWRSRVSESVSRLSHAPAFVLSRALAEARGPLSESVTTFIGDVFVYLAGRGEPGEPGPIPKAVIAVMRQAAERRLVAEEPMILVTHSMGGQVAYDLVTSFLAREPDQSLLRVDFWCATASQVGLFQELDLFVSHPPRDRPAPTPSDEHLGYWWNVWDYNDFLSYSAAGIVEGVDDESYSSGLSVLSAHSGYLRRPSFYRRFADKLQTAERLRYGRRP